MYTNAKCGQRLMSVYYIVNETSKLMNYLRMGRGLKIKITTHTTSSYAEFMIDDNVLPFLIRHITLHMYTI